MSKIPIIGAGTSRGPGGAYHYKHRIPWDIVEIFEKNGFIWGGKWHHYDTMHFDTGRS